MNFVSSINVISGANACGKTSILEAIWCSANGRSFRTKHVNDIIREGADIVQTHFIMQKDGLAHHIGFRRNWEKNRFIHNDVSIDSAQRMSRLVPLVFIGPDGLRFLLEEPELRRRFIDRALFLNDEEYWGVWKDYRRALKQRNLSLRQKSDLSEIIAWEKVLVEKEGFLRKRREDYLQELQGFFGEFLGMFFDDNDNARTRLEYYPGYSRKELYASVLERQRLLDTKQLYTFSGAHRGDVEVLYNDSKITNKFSRGQLKMVVFALYFAQLAMSMKCGVSPIVLIDDFSSELDEQFRLKVLSCLSKNKNQVFISTVDEKYISNCDYESIRLK